MEETSTITKRRGLRPTGIKKARPSFKRTVGLKKKAKKTPEAKLKEQLWALCKKIIRERYGNTCYTCPATDLVGSNWHTGHFIPSSICGTYLRYDLRNLRPQCFRCNISLVGNGSAFYRKLQAVHGQSYVDELFEDKKRDVKMNLKFLREKIEEYKTYA